LGLESVSPGNSAMTDTRTLLLIIGERDALAWILREQRMAFASHREKEASALAVGDQLLMYTTRGCFHNPTRDRGRIIGMARVASRAARLDEPLEFAGREFELECKLRIPKLAPLHGGLELAPLVSRLASFPASSSWRVRLRQTLVPLISSDAQYIAGLLDPLLRPRTKALDAYLAAAGSAGVMEGR
jgi:hypothetical protein